CRRRSPSSPKVPLAGLGPPPSLCSMLSNPLRRCGARVPATLLAIAAAAALAAFAPVPVFAQAPAAPVAAAPPMNAQELEQLVGRIALYPDDLVAVILPASTNPLQIVQADRFLEQRKAN